MTDAGPLFQPLALPCGVVLKNRVVKSAMSDSLGDGAGNPTPAQARLYERWALGGAAVSIVGEVQGAPQFAEKPGNLVLRGDARSGAVPGTCAPRAGGWRRVVAATGPCRGDGVSAVGTAKGPSAIDVAGLKCEALSREEIAALPGEFARTAKLARDLGFGGVQVHAAHGFLLSQFLSPLFNRRQDGYGGSGPGRMRLLLEVIEAVRAQVGPRFPVTVKLNASDQIEGGLESADALDVVSALEATSIDLIDISGGTYFPGARSASGSGGSGPYFIGFARQARERTSKPLMLTAASRRCARQARRSPAARWMLSVLPVRWRSTRTCPAGGGRARRPIRAFPGSSTRRKGASPPGTRCG